MSFEKAFKALSSAEWDWTPEGFEKVMKKVGATRKTKDKEMPKYTTPWGGLGAQAIIDKTKVRRVEFFLDVTDSGSDGFTPEEMEAYAEQYEQKLANYRVVAEKLVGKPKKVDGSRVEWKLPTAKLQLKWNNAGEITPFWISILLTR